MSMHRAYNHGPFGFAVYRIDDNGGVVVQENIRDRRTAERVAAIRDVQEAAADLDAAIARLDATD